MYFENGNRFNQGNSKIWNHGNGGILIKIGKKQLNFTHLKNIQMNGST